MNKNGFTFIDFISIMTIVGILFTIVIPQFYAYKAKQDGTPQTLKSEKVETSKKSSLLVD